MHALDYLVHSPLFTIRACPEFTHGRMAWDTSSLGIRESFLEKLAGGVHQRGAALHV